MNDNKHKKLGRFHLSVSQRRSYVYEKGVEALTRRRSLHCAGYSMIACWTKKRSMNWFLSAVVPEALLTNLYKP